MNFPALPAGFEVVDENEAAAPPVAAKDAPAAPKDAGGFPALPEGFEPVEDGEPTQKFEGRDFGLELNRRIREHEINSQEEAEAFAAEHGEPGLRVDVRETIAARDEGARVTNRTINDNSIKLWLAHKEQQGEDISKYLEMDTDELYGLATEEYRQQVKASMERRGIDTESGAIVRFIGGLGRSPEQLAEGLAQLGIRGAEAAGIIEETSADDAIAYDARVRDEAAVRGTAGKVGNFVGDVAVTAPLPFKGVTRFGKTANTAATIGKRAASGSAASALKPTDTEQQQAHNAILGAVAAPLLVPVVERAIAMIGNAGAEAIAKISGQGIGNKIYDDAGRLTPYGRALRARLKAVNPTLPDEFIDETLDVIVRANPRRLPKDESVVQDALADNRKVPLTAGMKEQDSHRIADFEMAQAGKFGDKVQKQAEEVSQNIDDAVRTNIRAISPTGATSDDAATSVARKLDEAEDAAAAQRDELYNALKESNEHIVDPAQLRTVIKAFNDDLAGQAEADIASPIAKQFLVRIRDLMQRGAMSTSRELKIPSTALHTPVPGTGKAAEMPPPLRFGELWKLSRDINEMARATAGTADGVYMAKIRRAMNDFIGGMTDDMFASGSNGVAKQLKAANAANKDFMDTFAARSSKTRSQRTVKDQAGESLENIVTHVRESAKRGEPTNPAIVEREIFGSAKGVTSSTAKDAAAKIRRITAAVPETKDAIKTMSVNRVLTQVEEGLFVKGLKADKLQTVVREIVESNRAVLEAAGWTKSDITSLQMNAYLASLKALPKGARNPSGSGKWIKVAIGTAFRRAIASIAAAGAGGAIAGVVNPWAAALVGTVWVGSKVATSRVAKRALTGKVKPRGRGEGTATTRKVGQKVAAPVVRQVGDTKTDEEDEDE